MNRRALNFALAYSLLVIIFKMAVLLGGYYTSSRFAFYYSHLLSVLLILPFYYVCIRQVRDRERGGVISGRESMRLALTILGISIVIISFYNYIEFEWRGSQLAVEYYNSQEYLDVLTKQQLRYPDKIRKEDFPRIIEEQIRDLSAFKAATGKIIPMMFIGLGGAFLMSMLLKRNPRSGAAAGSQQTAS